MRQQAQAAWYISILKAVKRWQPAEERRQRMIILRKAADAIWNIHAVRTAVTGKHLTVLILQAAGTVIARR